MIGGDLAEQERIVDEAAKKVDALDQLLARRDFDDRRIVRSIETHHHALTGLNFELAQHLFQYLAANLGTAATTTHYRYFNQGVRLVDI